ncbi:MAG TPA: ornithine cyclodeaminase family protein [Conexibacter sp.]|jgi:ornithine cyclodeaminase/alanine dehydrogenase
MTLYLSADDVRALATHELTLAAARAAVEAERAGRAIVPPRHDVDLERGFLRVMPAAYHDLMGLKVMTLVRGLGTRYLILVYSQATGELLALLDADEVTRLRTAATTAVAGQLLAPAGTSTLALVGSGFEAEGHLRAFANLWPLEQVLVFSRSRERREEFCARMSDELGISVRAVETVAEATSAAPVAVLATKATDPVVDGTDFQPGTVVLSIGSTRPDLRELDRATMRRSALLLVDDATQVKLESGDVIDGLGCGALAEHHLIGMADAVAGLTHDGGLDGRDLLSFKSVGTALQDLALASAAVEAARAAGRGRELGELTRLKPFAAPTQDALSAIAANEGPR